MEASESLSWRNKLNELGIVVIIPTYNNASTLESVILGVKSYSDHILVINDGCTDETTTILKKYPDLIVVQHPVNKGKGVALKNGLTEARQRNYRYAITIDSDGQHYPSDIPVFIKEIEETPDALLIGARNLNSDNMPGKNTFANRFSNFWFRLETGINLADTQSGFRIYPLQHLNFQQFYYTAKYEFELEAIVFAAWKDIPVKNIPIRVYYPPKEERISHFRPLRDFTRISILNTFLVLIAFLWIWPRNFFRKLSITNIKLFFDTHVRHSKDSNKQLALAIMLGVFMGIIPAWGYQTLLTLFFAHLFKLNKIIAVLAANISIPPMIPFLLYGSYVTGCKVLGREVVLGIHTISLENIKMVLEQYLIGSFIFAIACCLFMGALSFGILSYSRKVKQA